MKMAAIFRIDSKVQNEERAGNETRMADERLASATSVLKRLVSPLRTDKTTRVIGRTSFIFTLQTFRVYKIDAKDARTVKVVVALLSMRAGISILRR